ncbi:uncharacterized protein A1O5_02711 [Cladophialophora psammophila CBS 110553]|uniref:Uncharacterized protein n=1 Tax=Cladophialophora psammophila CBS 110553 TaxID=1182543 RepID=W9XAS6_9EURO|nr:uncharacterized protein A1O5_02711 [Cladophialophora psammophila CBS 110553]EXJ74415.1 hypothetical protein A1O5_02711 [Cladophialophora psammophila CBS 110553]
MVELIPPPDPLSLLPPLLACLPTSFASPRPPPALLPLLSPILRQRLQIHTSTSSRDNWAALLCWDAKKGEVLRDKIEGTVFEPHPASGEIEVGETHPITYKRFDEETLRAQIPLIDWPFTTLYVWCTGSEEGNSWKLAELLPFDQALQKDPSWSTSVAAANESSKERLVNEALQEADDAANARGQRNLSVPPPNEDDYWAMYDHTPSRTPARKESVHPPQGPSEEDYYARYGSVQPAMDNHDPDEEMEGIQEPRLNGHALQQMLSGHQQPHTEPEPPPYQGSFADHLLNDADDIEVEVNHPVPSSPSSRGSDAVARLEEHAERYGASEIGIRQHISTSMKSMYRLARSAGINREEFERMMQRELETLSLLDLDE